MKKSFFAMFLVALLLLSACGEKGKTMDEENCLRLYYSRSLQEADGGDAIAYVPVPWDDLPEEGTQEQAETVLALLLGGCRDENFRSPIPAGTQLNSCAVQGTMVLVDFVGSYGQLSGMGLTMADYCVTLSLTQLPDIYAVRITVGGKELDYRDTNRFLASDVLLTSTEDVVRTLTAKLYFLDSDGALQTEERLLTLYEGESRAGVVLSALENGPEKGGLKALLPEGFTPQFVLMDGGVCYVNLSNEELDVLLGQETVVLTGIVNSLCSVEGVESVQFLLDGEIQPGVGGMDISGPLSTMDISA